MPMLSRGTAGCVWNSPLLNQGLRHLWWVSLACVRAISPGWEMIKGPLEELSRDVCLGWIQRPASSVTGWHWLILEHTYFRGAEVEKERSQLTVMHTTLFFPPFSPSLFLINTCFLVHFLSSLAPSQMHFCAFSQHYVFLKTSVIGWRDCDRSRWTRYLVDILFQ